MLEPEPGRTATVATARERRAAQARRAPPLPLTSVAHPLTLHRLRDTLRPLEQTRAAGVAGPTVAEVTANWDGRAQEVRRQRHPPGYEPPPGRRVGRPKPGQAAARPRGRPTGGDRALQPRTAQGRAALDAQDVLNGSCGGRPGRSAQPAWATRHDSIAGQKLRDGLAAARRHCCGSRHQTWALRFIQRRVGEPRRLPLRRRWRTAGVLRPDGTREDVERGTPPGGRSSGLLSHGYRHEGVEGWFAKKRRQHLEGDASWGRSRDDGVRGFPYRSEARRVHTRLAERLHPGGLARAPAKTRLIAGGRFAQRDAATPSKHRPEPCSFLGGTPSGTRQRQGNCQGERSTERQRLQRATPTLQRLIRDRLHAPVPPQQQARQQELRGHDNSYGIAGNRQHLLRLSRRTEKLWRQTVSRRSQDGEVHGEKWQKLQHSFPLARPKLSITYGDFQAYAKL
jgi:RNA-directed DNA polymerase